MSSANQKSMDINKQSIYGKCNLTCSFSFKYENSNSTAKNNEFFIGVSYDKKTSPPVTFKYQPYNVSQIKVYSPSLHLYDGAKVAAEIIIEHDPVKGGSMLCVCIPIIQSSDNSTAGGVVTQIIQKVAANAPGKGNTTNLNMNNFNLTDIVPRKPYFSYTNQASVNFIAFSKLDAISVNQTTLASLTKIIKPFQLVMTESKLFFNSDGPNTNKDLAQQGIYISCSPTGQSEEDTLVTSKKNYSFDTSSLFNNDSLMNFFSFLIIPAMLILVLLCFQILKKYSSTGSVPFVGVDSSVVK